MPARVLSVADDDRLGPEGYRLVAGGDGETAGVSLWVGGPAGRRHAEATLAQLAHRVNAPGGEADGQLPACTVEDWPDLAQRAVMLDTARDKVPTLETVQDLVGRLGAWKINQLQLYTEHSFAYAGHEEVWRHADPYDASDVAALDAACAGHGLALVPNQNTLGHFERWLRHLRYRPLAIAPDGFEWLLGIHRNPTTLDPARPEAFALVADLVGQLAPLLPDRPFHLGLDEPWELRPERRGEWADWLAALARLPALAGRRLLVWGDVPVAEPSLLGRLPASVTVCEWGYEDNHPFDQRAGQLAEAGVDFWLCPGTSSWLSVTGRVDNMLGNLRGAARAAVAHGASGLLVTDWGDMGYLQPLVVSDPGLAAGAALAWCAEANASLGLDELAAALDAFCYDDPAGELGGAVVDLGRVHRLVTPRPFNISPLVQHLLLPQWPVGQGFTAGLRLSELDAVDAALDAATARVRRARPRRPDARLLAEELELAAGLLHLGCEDARRRLAGDGTLGSVPAALRARLAERCDELTAEHRRLWTTRNRPGGLADSAAWLEHLADAYRQGGADRSWFGPLG